MAYESQFSWRKILSFFGVGALALCGIVCIAGGINLIVGGTTAAGILSIIGGVCALAVSVLIYRSYNKYSRENNNPMQNYKR